MCTAILILLHVVLAVHIPHVLQLLVCIFNTRFCFFNPLKPNFVQYEEMKMSSCGSYALAWRCVLLSLYCYNICCVIACSHRRRRQDKTALSCLHLCSHRRRGLIETGSRRDKTVLSVVWTQLETRQNSLVSSRRQCVQAINYTHYMFVAAIGARC